MQVSRMGWLWILAAFMGGTRVNPGVSSEHTPSAQASPVLAREFPDSTISASHLVLHPSSRCMVGTCFMVSQ